MSAEWLAWDEDAIRVFDFDAELEMSKGIDPDGPDSVLLSAIPGALTIEPATSAEDRSGVDKWVICDGGRRIGVDVKRRKEDWAAKPSHEDDLALESWSVVGRRRGWTLDPTKRCEYILWWWADTGRWCLIPFVLLRAVFSENVGGWSLAYRTQEQETAPRNGHPGWRSECVFVPRIVVWRAIYERFGGTPVAA